MTGLITAFHIIVCIILVIAVLLQSGKAADLAGAFGGIGSQTAFGPRGTATILSKMTTICAILFMLTSLGLWIFSAREGKSVLSGEEAPQKEVPATTEPKKDDQDKPAVQVPETEKKEQTQETEKKEPVSK